MCNIFILRNEQCIEFRNVNNLSQILYTHSVAPHIPDRLCTVNSCMLLYEDRSKNACKIRWLDCNEAEPKLLKEKSLTPSVQYITDMIGVRNGADELIIGTNSTDIHCYSTTTKSLKWSVSGKLPGMQQELDTEGLATDGCGHLFVSDGYDGNSCIQIFSVSDGRYRGCLIRKGEQGLGYPSRIRWYSASQSLAVAHYVGGFWSLSIINIEY